MLGRIFETNELEKLVTREIALTNRRQAAVVQLAKAREVAGMAMLEGDAVAETETVSRLAAEIDATTRAISMLRARRPAVIAAENRREAGPVRAAEEAKRRELTSMNTKTGKLLVELSKLEGVEYGHWLLGYQKEGLVAAYSVVKTTPRSEKLALEIQLLEAKASALETAAPAVYGYVDLEGVTGDEEIIAAVLRHRSAAPSAEAVLEWLAACADSNYLPDRTFGARVRRVRVEWNEAKIDLAASYVFVPELTKRRSGVMQTNGAVNPGESSTLFDVKSGEFRSRVAA